MNSKLSNVTLACCRCCLQEHVKDLEIALYNTTIAEFRYTCECEIKLYKSALSELSNF